MSAISFGSLLDLISSPIRVGRAAITPFLLISRLGFAQGADAPSPGVGLPTPQFMFWRAGRIDAGHWSVVSDAASPDGVAIQRSDHDRSLQPALAVYTRLSARDARVRMHFRLIGGSAPSAGVALRITAPHDYYLVRASAAEQHVALLHVVHDTAEKIAGVDAEIAHDHWRVLEVTARDRGFTIFLDGQWILTAFDDGTPAAGQFGIWTERDDVTRFSEIEVSALAPDHERGLQDRFGG